MRRFLVVALAGLFVLSGCPKEKAATTAAATEAPAGRPLALWSVSKPGMPTSHLFGTCHMGVALSSALSPEGEAHLRAAKTLVMEADIENLDEETMMRRMSLPEGTTVSSLIGEPGWSRLAELGELGPMAEFFDRLHPMVLSTIYTLKVSADVPGSSPDAEMDAEYLEIAKEAGVPRRFLETAEQQLDLLLGIPMDTWLAPLRDVVAADSLDPVLEDTRAALNICITGDLSGWDVLRGSMDILVQSTLLADRNRAWMPQLQEVMAEGPAFVAVGAAHMLGDDGLIAGLQAAGWTVTRQRGVTDSAEAGEEWVPSADSAEFVDELSVEIADSLCPVVHACMDVDLGGCPELMATTMQSCSQAVDLPETITGTNAEEVSMVLSMCVLSRLVETYGEPKLDDPACKAAGDALE